MCPPAPRPSSKRRPSFTKPPCANAAWNHPRADCKADQIEITRSDSDEKINVVRLAPLDPLVEAKTTVVILSSPSGALPYLDSAGRPVGLARAFLDQGFSIVVATAPGPSAAPEQNSLFFTAYNRTRLQERVRDLVSMAQGIKAISPANARVALCGDGVAGLWCLLAAPAADAVIADCDQTDISNDEALLNPDLFCPGLRAMDSFEGALILAAPHPLLMHNTADRFPVARLRSSYRTLGARNSFRLTQKRWTDERIAAWLAALQ